MCTFRKDDVRTFYCAERNIAIARNMLKIGMKKEDIQKVTGLTREELEKL